MILGRLLRKKPARQYVQCQHCELRFYFDENTELGPIWALLNHVENLHGVVPEARDPEYKPLQPNPERVRKILDRNRARYYAKKEEQKKPAQGGLES